MKVLLLGVLPDRAFRGDLVGGALPAESVCAAASALATGLSLRSSWAGAQIFSPIAGLLGAGFAGAVLCPRENILRAQVGQCAVAYLAARGA
jgi:hypothetical protein